MYQVGLLEDRRQRQISKVHAPLPQHVDMARFYAREQQPVHGVLGAGQTRE